MRESEYMVRNTKGEIDAHKSIHAFAMALGRQLREEQEIRKDRKIKRAIQKVFKDNPGVRLTLPFMVQMVARLLDVTYSEYGDTIKRIETHIKLNTKKGGYLQTIQGASGGLFKRGES
jgi:hypothetical protein